MHRIVHDRTNDRAEIVDLNEQESESRDGRPRPSQVRPHL